jgi:hypothetical protein
MIQGISEMTPMAPVKRISCARRKIRGQQSEKQIEDERNNAHMQQYDQTSASEAKRTNSQQSKLRARAARQQASRSRRSHLLDLETVDDGAQREGQEAEGRGVEHHVCRQTRKR